MSRLPEVLNYARAIEFNPQPAGQKLARLYMVSWFGSELLAKARVSSDGKKEAINDLADVYSRAGKNLRSNYACCWIT